MRIIERRFAANIDWVLCGVMIALCGIGLFVLYSAGYDPETASSEKVENQAMAMGIGMAAFFIALFLQSSFWRRWAYPLYATGCLLLLAILVIGYEAKGAQRWLALGGFRMQPSEFMKLGIILALAKVFTSERAPTDGYTLRTLLLPGAVLLLPLLLTLVQPDLGTALCQGMIGASLIFLAGVRFKTFSLISFVGALGVIPVWGVVLKPYQRERILNFLTPERDPLGSGYHAIQSKIAVGSGALSGKGLLQGTQTQLRFLPEQTTDFIFSVLAEEWGFIGSFIVIALYGMLIYRILKTTSRTEDKFLAYVCFGIAALIFWQVTVNVGMVTGVLPVVGITLPLLSYGGSSVVTIMIGLGLVAGTSARRFLFT